jgi:hypothetical protein
MMAHCMTQRRQEEKRFIASPEKDAKFGKRY